MKSEVCCCSVLKVLLDMDVLPLWSLPFLAPAEEVAAKFLSVELEEA